MVELIPYRPAFLDAFIEWRSQPLAIRHNPLLPMTRDELAEMLETDGWELSDLRKHERYRWFIEIEGAVAGTVSLKNISHAMGYGEIGYSVGAPYQRKGIATAAVRRVARMCFTESPLRKLIAHVHDQNVASRRVLQKVGFTQEGLLREHYIINGVPENEILFGLLKHEWKE